MCRLRDVTCTDPTAWRCVGVSAMKGGGPLHVQGLGGWAMSFSCIVVFFVAARDVMALPGSGHRLDPCFPFFPDKIAVALFPPALLGHRAVCPGGATGRAAPTTAPCGGRWPPPPTRRASRRHRPTDCREQWRRPVGAPVSCTGRGGTQCCGGETGGCSGGVYSDGGRARRRYGA